MTDKLHIINSINIYLIDFVLKSNYNYKLNHRNLTFTIQKMYNNTNDHFMTRY